jgi:hypothetical protein
VEQRGIEAGRRTSAPKKGDDAPFPNRRRRRRSLHHAPFIPVGHDDRRAAIHLQTPRIKSCAPPTHSLKLGSPSRFFLSRIDRDVEVRSPSHVSVIQKRCRGPFTDANVAHGKWTRFALSPGEKVAASRMRGGIFRASRREDPHPPLRGTFSRGEKGRIVESFGQAGSILLALKKTS